MRCPMAVMLLSCALFVNEVLADPGMNSAGLSEGDVALAVAQVDRLLVLQDDAAAGSHPAVAEQQEVLLEITGTLERISESEDALLKHQVVAFVLSGGDPEIAARFTNADPNSNPHQLLLEAAAAFMRGDHQKANDLFAKIDPSALPARLGGRVALAKALLTKGAARQDLFALAAAAMPGTAIEESALRRLTLAYAEARDEHGFWKTLERYVRRFPSSIYAQAFWEDVTATLVYWAVKNSVPSLYQLDVIVTKLSLQQRRSIYLALARKSAAAGLPEMTGFAARRVRRAAVEGSDEDQLGQFYTVLYDIVSPESDAALTRLRSIHRNALGIQETALLGAALSLGLQIERPPSRPPEDTEEMTDTSGLAARGAELLTQSHKLMAEEN